MREELLTSEQRAYLDGLISSGRCKGETDTVYEILSSVTDLLSAERARRIKAEEVVDAAVAQNKNGILYECAYNYRAQYPRVEKEKHK